MGSELSIAPDGVPDDLIVDFDVYDYHGEDPFETTIKMHSAKLPDFFWTRRKWRPLGRLGRAGDRRRRHRCIDVLRVTTGCAR
jgi:hypothetical protein